MNARTIFAATCSLEAVMGCIGGCLIAGITSVPASAASIVTASVLATASAHIAT